MKMLSAFALYIFTFSKAQAYLDPGTGSILIQSLIAGIAAAALVIKTYWYRIKSFFGGAKSGDIDEEDLVSRKTEQQDTSR